MITIFDVLSLFCGLALFLYGMDAMGNALKKSAGSGLKNTLSKMTSSPLRGFLLGLGVTAIIQSSSATTVMVVGFVNSKVMTLKQSIGVIMGANIGTTVTAWLLSLGGISSDNVVLKLLKPSSFTPILALIGIALVMFSKSSRRKDVGTILLGFATLMFGMDAMSGAVKGLADVPEFQNLFLAFKNPILGVLVGAFVTAVIQSSSASVGILQALSVTGAVSYSAAIPIIMGQNIGTCVTAMLSSFGANKNAKRASFVHLLFNLVGTVIWLTVFSVISLVMKPAILDASASYLGIAVCHSIFNVLCTVILLPASSLLEKLAYRLIPEGKTAERTVELDERLLVTPAIAIAQCERLAGKMATEAISAFRLALSGITAYDAAAAASIRQIEENTDRYEDILGTYLAKLSRSQVSDEDSAAVTKLLKVIGDFERISDHAVNLLEAIEELREKRITLSPAAQGELCVLCGAVGEILTLSEQAYLKGDAVLALEIEPLEQVIDQLKGTLRDRHIARLQDGICTVETGFIWSDLLTNLERVSDHCSNIAVGILDEKEKTLSSHEVLRVIKQQSPEFLEKYAAYLEKYAVPAPPAR